MARKITISFKETTKDIELYKLIVSMEDKSAEIKRILREVLKKENILQKPNKDEKGEKEEIDILNI